jgi:hypothetical protein
VCSSRSWRLLANVLSSAKLSGKALEEYRAAALYEA